LRGHKRGKSGHGHELERGGKREGRGPRHAADVPIEEVSSRNVLVIREGGEEEKTLFADFSDGGLKGGEGRGKRGREAREQLV